MLEVSGNTHYTYTELVSITLANLLPLIANRDGYSVGVPNELKPDFVRTDTLPRTGGPHEGQYPVTITYSIDNDATLETVSTEQIASEFYAFLESRGIATKSDMPATTKGIINFFNNVSAFCSVKLVLVTSDFTTSEFIFYNKQTVTYPTVPVVDDTVRITDANVQSMLANLNSTINSVSKLHVVKYVYASNSSSSSSSSSCSSAYIAYFNLQ